MGKASNWKSNKTSLTSALSIDGATVYRRTGVNPKHGQLVVNTVQSIRKDNIAGVKSQIEALERKGVSIFEFSVGFDDTASGIPACVCAWALAVDARGSLPWLIKKAFNEGRASELPFFQKLFCELESCAPGTVEFSRIEFATTTFLEFSVRDRPQWALDSVPEDLGPRARAIVIHEAQKELARLTKIELDACIPAPKPQDTCRPSPKKATASGGGRL